MAEQSGISQEDLDLLLTTALETAFALLERHGEFFPLLFELRGPGDVQTVAVLDRTSRPTSQDLIESYHEILRPRAAAGEMLATAIAVYTRVMKHGSDMMTDAVQVRIRAIGYARDVFAPYLLETTGLIRKKRTLTRADIYASAAENEVF